MRLIGLTRSVLQPLEIPLGDLAAALEEPVAELGQRRVDGLGSKLHDLAVVEAVLGRDLVGKVAGGVADRVAHLAHVAPDGIVDRRSVEQLLVNETEAELVRRIFARFLQLGSALRVAEELDSAGETTKAWVTQAGHRRHGGRFTKGAVYKLLNNRVYLGLAVHKGTAHPGEHEAIIDRKTWDKVQAVRAENLHARGNATRAQTPALLKGLIFGPSGRPMSPTHTRKQGRLYRYYVTAEANTRGYKTCPLGCVPAAEIEAAVIAQVRRLLRTPEIIARTWAQARRQSKAQIPERAVREALLAFEPLWDELFPAEQARLIRLLVGRVDVAPDGITIRLRTAGLASLVGELRRAGPGRGQDAA